MACCFAMQLCKVRTGKEGQTMETAGLNPVVKVVATEGWLSRESGMRSDFSRRTRTRLSRCTGSSQ